MRWSTASSSPEPPSTDASRRPPSGGRRFRVYCDAPAARLVICTAGAQCAHTLIGIPIWHRVCNDSRRFRFKPSLPELETMMGTEEKLHVLVVDNDPNVSELVSAILTDEGYAVTTLHEVDHPTIAATVGSVEPDCILLDSAEGPRFGGSWSEAAYLQNRARAVPTVMFSAHAEAIQEAREGSTERAVAAGFAAIVSKPFSLDELLDAVETATGRSHRFDRSEEGDNARTAQLVERLQDAGAADIRTSNRREWATFVSPVDDRIYQLYWWQRLGRYMVGRYDDDARLEMVGHFFERHAAIDAALRPLSAEA